MSTSKYAEHYAAQIEVLRAKRRAYQQRPDVRERARSYYQQNRHKRWESEYRSRAKAYGFPVVLELFTEDELIAHWGNGRRCIYCDGAFEEIDHMIPVSAGGEHTLGNVAPSCTSCNSKAKPVLGRVGKCDGCGDVIESAWTRGRVRRFCSNACRQRAYRQRAVSLPVELRESRRWMRYRLVPRGDRVTKVPTRVGGGNASSTDSRTWSSYRDAKASKVGDGLGFALGEGVGCVDLDSAITDGNVVPWAQDVLDANPDTFTEVSQSGTGIHVWGLLPEGRGRVIRDGRNIEIYSAGRFIALGTSMPGTSKRLRPLVVPE